MKITQEQYERIAELFPRQRGNVSINNLQLLNAVLYLVEHGCKWRGLPECYGKWDTIYKRVNRWAKDGVLQRVFLALQKEQIIRVDATIVALDSTCIKVHPDGCGALKKVVARASEKPGEDGTASFMWSPQMIRL